MSDIIITIKIPDDKAHELEGLVNILTEFGKVLSGAGASSKKLPAAPKRETKAQRAIRVAAKIEGKLMKAK